MLWDSVHVFLPSSLAAVRLSGQSAPSSAAWISTCPRRMTCLALRHGCSPVHPYLKGRGVALPVLQRQLALETIAALSSSVPEAHHVYTDGSVQADGRAGSAVFSPDTDLPPGGWVGSRLPDSSCSTFCELYGILDAVSLLSQRGLSGVVIILCDSKSALLALSSAKPTCPHVVLRIISFFALL